jgi:hypothetical protein
MPTAETFRQTRLILLGHAALTLLLAAIFLFAHAHYLGVPAAYTEAGGWSTWADQAKYLEAARAWAAWDLTAARHWYPPGYPLLGAPFLPITPFDRFLLPNLGCLIASQYACAALARRMFPHNRYASLRGAAAFLVASVGTIAGLKSWLIPWTTTPAAALTFMAFVAVLRLAEHPGIGRALLAGSAIGGIVFFRPTDAAPVALAAAAALAPRLLSLPIRTASAVAVASVCAAMATAALAAAIIAATSGFGPDTYYALSAHFGFDLRLLPLRFVSLVIDGRPIFDGVGTERVEPGLHRGLAEVFPWIIAGAGGIAACWFPGGRRVHILLTIWLALHLALVLCYRDLHIEGLWLYGNYHYFKVTQPVFLLYALMLAVRLADRATRWRAAVASVVAIMLLFCWRASLVPVKEQVTASVPGGIAIPSLGSLDDAAIVPGTGSWEAIYYGKHVLTIGGRQFLNRYDFRLYPRRSDLLLVPLRPLPPGLGELAVADGVRVAANVPAVKLRQVIAFGVPCMFRLAGSAICGSLGAPLIPSR